MRDRAWALALFLVGCAHSDDEWRRQVRANDDLRAKLAAEQAKASGAVAERTEATAKLDQLDHDLRELGIDPAKLRTSAEEQARAMVERSRRRSQLESARKRFEALKAKLGSRAPAVVVTARENLVTVELAGASLFDKGRDKLRPEGKAILVEVAAALRSDKDAATRSYRVLGRLNGAARGPAPQALAQSLARASEMLEVLATPSERGGGGLPRARLVAAGSGDASTGGPCAIVVEPTAEELPALPTGG